MNSLDVKAAQLDSRHSLEQELVSPLDDGIYKLHRTYSLQSSCKTGIQADQVSQEKHSLFARHKIPRGQSQNGMGKMSLEILH
jgi:hypothetical protein